jgi:transcriptional regulator GlxA family with amidase domain
MTARRVVIVGFEGVELLDLAGPLNVFTAADRLVRPGHVYRIVVAASRSGAIATAGGGIEIVATTALKKVRPPVDTLLVAGGSMEALARAESLVPDIARLATSARRVASVCSGAFLLGAAGLLAGRRVTTHWASCGALARRYPDCVVESDPIFVRDHKVWTSAGVTAGMDLALALVEQDHGRRVALEIARWLVMYLRRPGGQSQFSAMLEAQRADDSELAHLVAWMAENLRADLSVTALAKRAAMSPRHFGRLFHRETGATPAVLVGRLRLEAARRALEVSTRSVKQIAYDTGFGTPETLHRAFRRALGTTPLAYRSRFGSEGHGLDTR